MLTIKSALDIQNRYIRRTSIDIFWLRLLAALVQTPPATSARRYANHHLHSSDPKKGGPSLLRIDTTYITLKYARNANGTIIQAAICSLTDLLKTAQHAEAEGYYYTPDAENARPYQ